MDIFILEIKMKKLKYIISLLSFFVSINCTSLYASTFFSGYAGGKVNFSGKMSETNGEEKYDPDLKLQAFFAGQFNFNQNMWTRMEVSVNTEDFISSTIFHETQALFQIDELSFTLRGNTSNKANYLSAYMGTYDSIGSDIFLLRYFSIQPIASKLTESWLGLAGSILYPHFGFGVSDIVKLYQVPVAFGGYAYLNHENDKFYVFNIDGRAACAFPYFTCDFAFGMGAPLENSYYGEDLILAISSLYWHAGTTMLIGNNYIPSLFFQAGLFNARLTKTDGLSIDKNNDIYILLEPRFYIKDTHLTVSLYNLPARTAENLLFIDDTLGLDFNFYSDLFAIKGHNFTIGTHTSISLVDQTIFMTTGQKFAEKGAELLSCLTSLNFNVNITPYISTSFLSGQIHGQMKIRIMDFVRPNSAAEAFSVDIGYKTSF